MGKPEALRLAEFCDGNVLYQPAAAELRRLSAENETLKQAVARFQQHHATAWIEKLNRQMEIVDAAIKAVEETK